MTRRELFGWVPTETQIHYNPAGEHVGTTVIERESRINDQDRAELLALAIVEADIGPCGYPHTITSDAENGFEPESVTCKVCAGLAKWDRILDDIEKKSVPHDAAPGITRPSDGRRTRMRMLSDDEAAQRRESRKPGQPPTTT